MTRAPVKEEFRWSLRKKGKHVLNVCKHVVLYGGLTAGLMTTTSATALANPTGGNVVGGSATITDTATELQINQHTDRALIEWASFDIDAGETTRFYQPNTGSIALNRVVNSNQVSAINGNLIANGRVVVINPNGVLIGANGNVDTAGFIATSADVDDEAFNNGLGAIEFKHSGNADAIVENRGNITVGQAGLAALVAPTVRNSGVVQGNMAKVQLAAADTFAVDFYGDGLIQFAVNAPADGETRTISAENSGSIIADGGAVLMTAADATDVVESVINSEGYIQAASLENRGGKIVLTGAGATVKVSGKMDVSGQGDADGGEILIGGDYQGQGDVPTAENAEITETAELYADGGENGSGGDIIVWSDVKTTSRGKYHVRGGSQSGDGGLIETSSKGLLDVNGTYANALATNGTVGDWLLDPDKIVVKNAGVPYTPLPATGTSDVDVTTINAALSNVILTANDSITFDADVNIAALGVSLSATAGSGGINAANNFIRTNNGDVTFSTTGAIDLNKTTVFTTGGDVSFTGDTVSMNNNAAIGTEGGSVFMEATRTGGGDTIALNNSAIDTSVSTCLNGNPTCGGIDLLKTDGSSHPIPAPAGDTEKAAFAGNNQTFYDSSENGGTVTLKGKKIKTNSVCINAGGSLACGVVADPVATDLTVTIDSFTKIYGAPDPTFTWGLTSGALTGGDTLSVDLARILQGLLAGEQVGNYEIFKTSHLVTGSGLYNITFINGNLEIVPASIVIKAVDQTKTYGDDLVLDETSPSSDFTVTGLVNSIDGNATGDTISGANLTSSGLVASANAGNYIITASGATGTNLSNYDITYDTGNLTVNKALLTATADDKSMTYGGTFPTLTATYTGFKNTDTVGDIDTLASLASGTAATADAGFYNDTLTASGAVDNNYNFQYVAGDLTINKAQLLVDVDDKSMTYGGVFPTLTAQYTGFVNGDNLGDVDTLANLSSGTVATADAGFYADTLTGSGAADNNYTFVYDAGDLTINKALLTVNVDDKSMTYGGVFPTLTAQYTGFVNGDNLGDVDTQASLVSGTVASADAGFYNDTLTASGAVDNNYNFAYNAGDLTINKAALQVTALGDSKVYDGLAYSGGNGVTYIGFVNGDDAGDLGGALGYGGSSQGATNVGGYVISANGLTSGNYVISYVNGALNITPAALAITASNQTKTYGDTFNFTGGEFTTSGLQNGETLTTATLSSLGAVNTASVAGSTYDIDISNAGGGTANLSNYTVTYNKGQMTVNPAALTITANNDAKVYDAVAYSGGNGVTYGGFVNGENANTSDLTGTIVYGGSSQGATNVGNYVITASGQSSSNYAITYNDGQLDITAAALLLVAADNQTKTYGDSFTFNGTEFTPSGLLGTDSVTSATITSAGAVNTANAGNYSIDISNAVGTGLGNYSISYAPGTFTVNKALLTVTANDKSMTYGGTAPTLTDTITGFVNSENAGVIDTTGSVASGTLFTADAGVYTDTLNSSGYADNNYDFQYVAGDLTISKALLLGLTNSDSKVYDGLAYSGGNGVNYLGFVNGDNSGDLSGTLSYSGASQGAVNVGPYGILGGGQSSGNYNIIYVGNTVLITPAALSITADNQVKTYGDTFTFNGDEFTASGLVNGETLTSATLSSLGAVNTASVAGSDYDIDISNAGGGTANLANYSVTYNKGALTVNPAALTVTANNDSKVYDAAAYSGGNGVTYAGFVNGDGALDLGGTLTYGGTSQGATNVGAYDIEASGLTSTNYTISYVDGALNITPAALQVTANNDSKIYDANPYSGGNGVSYSGFVGGEDENTSDLTGTVVYGGSSQGAVNVAGSPYVITASGLSSNNYTISYADGQLTITPRKLGVRADDKIKVYGDADPALTYSVFSGLQGSDTAGSVLSGAITRDIGENVGGYSIKKGTLSANSNYALSFVNGSLQITPADLLITANDDQKVEDGVPYSGGNGFTISGFKFSDDQSVLSGLGGIDYRGSSQGAVDPGNYGIDPFGKVGARNYRVTFAPGTLNITPAPVIDPIIPFEEIDPLGRPIISVANQAIVLDEPFEEIETLELETNVGISSASTGATASPEALAGITPAAGEEGVSGDAQQLASLEPAAGGDDQGGEVGEQDEFSRDLACANSFLDNKPCDIEGQQ